MKAGFLRNFSFSAMQLLMNQGLGLVLFLLLSQSLSKNDFGLLNWALALLLMAFTLLSFGMDQLLVRKIAAGNDARMLASAYFFHAFFGGLLLMALLAALYRLTPGLPLKALLVLGLGKFFFYLSLPFKSVAGGREKFNTLFLMSLPASLLKATGCCLLYALNRLQLFPVLAVFALADVAELLVCLAAARRLLPFGNFFRLHGGAYRRLLHESLPQFGIVVFSTALARLDQVVLRFFRGNSSVAEYSFAVRVCEWSAFPLLIIAPLLLPFASRRSTTDPRMRRLLRLELALAGISVLLLNLLWTPVMEPLTHGKYGVVNERTILILSGTLPLLYLNNYWWTISFAAGRLSSILFIFACSFGVNLAADLLLIPSFGSEGAALAYLLAIATQTALYASKSFKSSKPRRTALSPQRAASEHIEIN